MYDFITYAKLDTLRQGLVQLGLVHVNTLKPLLNISKVPTKSVFVDDEEHTLSIVRCQNKEEFDLLLNLEKLEVIQLLGEVIQGEYEFSNEENKDLYERLMCVGKYQQMMVLRDHNGYAILDSEQNTIKVPSVNYKFGLFA